MQSTVLTVNVKNVNNGLHADHSSLDIGPTAMIKVYLIGNTNLPVMVKVIYSATLVVAHIQ
jgi:hypothetical protein